MKKADDWVAKNLQTIMKKLQMTKRKATFLIIDRNATKNSGVIEKLV